MNKTKETLKKIKNHVVANKEAYVMGAVAIAAIAVLERNLRYYDKFLISKGIDPEEFHCPEAFEERNAI